MTSTTTAVPQAWGAFGAARRVRYQRSDIEATVRAAWRIGQRFVFATGFGYTASGSKPPFTQRYIELVPETSEIVTHPA